jgi:hypothetical protein
MLILEFLTKLLQLSDLLEVSLLLSFVELLQLLLAFRI